MSGMKHFDPLGPPVTGDAAHNVIHWQANGLADAERADGLECEDAALAIVLLQAAMIAPTHQQYSDLLFRARWTLAAATANRWERKGWGTP